MARPAMTSRNVDSKGRITLGESFANRTMLVEHRADAIVLRLAKVIPADEAWLYENEKALGLVRTGLEQARRREFVEGPVLSPVRRRGKRGKPGPAE